MSVFPPHFGFHGTWRPYQQRVLDNLQSCLDDRKVHIVAAPGSGKTTVGLEILLRLGKPALILAPSITIREQWIDRFVTSFLPENGSPDRWISRSIHSPKPLTVITYQALHSACNRLVGSESENGDDEEPGERENTDYSDFDLIGTLKKSGTGTVCLDEAHHLRSEWWKALETVVGALDGIVTVSLTATPPYDSTPAQWQRYIKLCGEIDAEIFTPELVKDHNLCPHQDYVYFNWPEQDEIDAIRRFRESACNAAFEVADEPTFTRAVSSHPGLTHIDDYTERFLDKPDYLTAILVFLSYHKIVFSKQLRKLIGTSAKLPRLDVHWMEVLLQGFLYHDADSYPAFEDYREELRKRLSRLGLISRKTVVLTSGDEINRLLLTSRGKLNSIREIVRAEHTSLAGKLRMLILTDYIKKDMVPLIGNPEEAVRVIGVVPIFEMLRREQTPGLKLGALSGGFVAVPRESKDLLQEIADRKSVGVSFKDLNCPDYVEAVFSGSNQKQMVSVVTELFSRGGIHVLVGTKSLLGEGWDSPCINSLILASFVGSYILSNQMRGRAIRVDPAVPDKTANIWHLVSMEPVWAYSESVRERISSRLNGTSKTECPVSEDFVMLRRRFQAFLGVSYTEDVIEDGIDRLSVIRPPYDRTNIEKIDRSMLQLAADRKSLAEKWQRAIANCPDASQVIEVSRLDKVVVPHRFIFFNALACFSGITCVELFFWTLGRTLIRAGGTSIVPALTVLLILFVVFGGLLIKYAIRMYRFFTPESSLKQIGSAVLKALRQIGEVQSYDAKAKTETYELGFTACYLDGGTTYEKNLFAGCIAEMFDIIDNPRYLLVREPRFPARSTEYFSVPEIFGSRKENAEFLVRCIQKIAPNYHLQFTRNPEGRRILLKARAHSFVSRNGRQINQKRKIKSKWE